MSSGRNDKNKRRSWDKRGEKGSELKICVLGILIDETGHALSVQMIFKKKTAKMQKHLTILTLPVFAGGVGWGIDKMDITHTP